MIEKEWSLIQKLFFYWMLLCEEMQKAGFNGQLVKKAAIYLNARVLKSNISKLEKEVKYIGALELDIGISELKLKYNWTAFFFFCLLSTCIHIYIILRFGGKKSDVTTILQVCRGTAVMLVSPTDGTDEIANPFMQPDGA